MRWMLVLLAGCAEVSYLPTNPPPRPLYRRAARDVEVFTAHVPDREFVEVGVLTATSLPIDPSGPWVGDERMMAKLRKEAGDYGCDGVVINGVDAPGQLRATCIVYRSDLTHR